MIDYRNFVKNILSSVISAIIIALIFALWSDSEFREYDLTGNWILITTIKKSNLSRYKNMELYHYAKIVQFSDNIILKAEKIKGKTLSNGIEEYKGKARTLMECKGKKKYNFFSKNKLLLNCEEFGIKRKSVMFLDLMIEQKNKMIGNFSSSIADSSGTVIIKKDN